MKELQRIWRHDIWLRILTLVSIALLVWGFVLPPPGVIDGSVIAAVGGARYSQHLKGQAADIVSDDFEAFRRFVRRWCKDNEFDQCIFEHGGGKEWIHISFDRGRNRRQIIDLSVG